jgi:hypothetical protein
MKHIALVLLSVLLSVSVFADEYEIKRELDESLRNTNIAINKISEAEKIISDNYLKKDLVLLNVVAKELYNRCFELVNYMDEAKMRLEDAAGAAVGYEKILMACSRANESLVKARKYLDDVTHYLRYLRDEKKLNEASQTMLRVKMNTEECRSLLNRTAMQIRNADAFLEV